MSGGLDSSILLAKLLDEGRIVQPFYVRSGLVWETCELRSARCFLDAVGGPNVRPLIVLEMPLADVYADHWSTTGLAVPDATSHD